MPYVWQEEGLAREMKERFFQSQGLNYVVAPTEIDRAKHARDQARIEHDAASAERARVSVTPDVPATSVGCAQQRLLDARTALYAAEGEYAALIREADIKAKIEEVEKAKRETLSKIEASIYELDADNSLEYNLDRDWDFLDDEAQEQLIRAVKSVLNAYRKRVVAS